MSQNQSNEQLLFHSVRRDGQTAQQKGQLNLSWQPLQNKRRRKWSMGGWGEEKRWDGTGLGAGERETDPEGIKRLANDLHWLQCVLWEVETGSRPLPLTCSDDTLQLAAATSQTDLMLFHKRVVCGGETSRRWEYFTLFHLVYGTTWTLRQDLHQTDFYLLLSFFALRQRAQQALDRKWSFQSTLCLQNLHNSTSPDAQKSFRTYSALYFELSVEFHTFLYIFLFKLCQRLVPPLQHALRCMGGGRKRLWSEARVVSHLSDPWECC